MLFISFRLVANDTLDTLNKFDKRGRCKVHGEIPESEKGDKNKNAALTSRQIDDDLACESWLVIVNHSAEFSAAMFEQNVIGKCLICWRVPQIVVMMKQIAGVIKKCGVGSFFLISDDFFRLCFRV
jgi:hypothetical protein